MLRSGEVGLGDGFVAMGAGSAWADSAGEEVAVRAAALVEVAGFALGTFVDDAGAGVDSSFTTSDMPVRFEGPADDP